MPSQHYQQRGGYKGEQLEGDVFTISAKQEALRKMVDDVTEQW